MIENVILALVGFGLFVGGAVVGAHNQPTVDKAIATIKSYEAAAQATLNKIAAHKAGQ